MSNKPSKRGKSLGDNPVLNSIVGEIGGENMPYILYAGIYSITCVPNGKVYIGRSVQIPVRRKRHEYDLRDGIHTNTEMQEDYNYYGKQSFKFDLVEEVPRNIPSEDLDALEMEYIEKYNSFYDGYNMTEGGFGNTGRKFSKETRKRMSEAHKRRGSGRNNKKRINIFGEEYEGIGETAEKLGMSRGDLDKLLKDPENTDYVYAPTTDKSRTTISKESRLQA